MGKKEPDKAAEPATSSLPYEEIHTLMRMVSEMGLGELHVQSRDLTIRVVGGEAQASGEGVLQAGSGSGEAPADEPGLHYVKSPMVGTYYQASRPEADPYARLGQEVSCGQVLCIVEAMKLMNEIEADADGVIEEICCEDAKPVEFGDRLFGIRTATVEG